MANAITQDAAIQALRDDMRDVKDGLNKVYDALSRLAVLEDNRARTDEAIQNLFKLYHDVRNEVARVERDLTAKIAGMGGDVKSSSKMSEWVVRGLIGVAFSAITAVITLALK